MNIVEKLTSRKFWICVAAFLASIATSIEGVKSDNEWIVTIGIICTVASAAIYAACESAVDSAAACTEVEFTEEIDEEEEKK